MTDNQFEHLEIAHKATVQRISAENTWLRHNFMELESRVEALREQIADLRRATHAEKRERLVKAKPASTPSTPSVKPSSRSKK